MSLLLIQPRNGHGPTVNTYHVIAIQVVYWRVGRIYRKYCFFYFCVLDHVYRAVAWQHVDQIRYTIMWPVLLHFCNKAFEYCLRHTYVSLRTASITGFLKKRRRCKVSNVMSVSSNSFLYILWQLHNSNTRLTRKIRGSSPIWHSQDSNLNYSSNWPLFPKLRTSPQRDTSADSCGVQ
jgi:hypothetical protein